MSESCPTCGCPVRVVTAAEGTSHYVIDPPALPDPDFFIHDQLIQPSPNMLVGRDNPMPDRPAVGVASCGLYTISTVRELMRRMSEKGESVPKVRTLPGDEPSADAPQTQERRG